jgi:branched-chain amino acid transport system substrate-binding protein
MRGRLRFRGRAVAVTLTGLLVLAGCGSGPSKAPNAPKAPAQASPTPATVPSAAASSGGAGAPIRIGFIADLTGVVAAPGHDMVNGWKLWWRQHGSTVDGHPVQTIYYDSASSPNTALTRARQAVEQDHVQMIVGTFLASESLAVAPYLIAHKIPFFLPTSSADDLTQRHASPYVLRIAGYTSSQPTHAAGAWAYSQGYRTAVTIGPSYAYGYETAGGFAQVFTQQGGRILGQLWAPLGTTNFSPYLSHIQALKPQVVFAVEVGGDVGHFFSQWKSFGLQGKYPLIGTEDLTDPSSIVGISADRVLNVVTVAGYAEGRGDPATQTFDQAYEKAFKVIPSYNSAACYTAAEWLDRALRAVKGDVADQAGFLQAVRAVRFRDTPLGPMRLDRYGNPVENEYVRRTVPFPGGRYAKVWNTVVKTYPDVSQFWTAPAAQYLKQPPYSATFQGMTGKGS